MTSAPEETTPARWALRTGDLTFPETGAAYRLSVHELGVVSVTSGRLLLGDTLEIVVRVPAGELRAVVTRALNTKNDDERVSHLSLLVPGRTEVRRGPLRESDLVADDPGGRPGDAVVGVDSGFVHAVDEAAARRAPGGSEWNTDPMNESPTGAAIAPFFADVPGSPPAAFCESGLGDGVYEVAGGFDANGDLAAIHVDFDLLYERKAPEPKRRRDWSTWFTFGVPVLIVAALVLIARACSERPRPYGRPVIPGIPDMPGTKPR